MHTNKCIFLKVNLSKFWQCAILALSLATVASFNQSCTNKAGASIFGSGSDDTIPPTLTTRGPMMIMEGEPHDSTFLTRGVKFADNSGAAKLEIDTSKVNWNRQGVYEVTYAVHDSAQNVTTVSEQLRVVGKDEKIVYLTFDDGPSVCTDQILSILRKENVKATFFVTAQFTPYLDRMRAIAKDGHEVAIHSYSHEFSVYKSIDAYFADLNKINDVIEKYTGRRARVMRFPGGSSNHIYRKYNSDPKFMDRLCVAVLQAGYQFVDWNLDSGDANGNNLPAARLVHSACGTYHNVECLLMHDTGAKRTTVTALPDIIHYFKQKGYEFGVLNSVDYVCWHGGAQKKARLQQMLAGGAGNDASRQTAAAKPAPAKKVVKRQPAQSKPKAAPKSAVKAEKTEVKKSAEPATHSKTEHKPDTAHRR